MLARSFQQIERACSVDAEVRERFARGPIMRRLGRRMDNDGNVLAHLAKQVKDCILVANVEGVVPVIGNGRYQLVSHPVSGSFLTKEVPAHVIVNTDHVHAPGGEMTHSFRADQSCRTSNERDAQTASCDLVKILTSALNIVKREITLENSTKESYPSTVTFERSPF